MDWLETVVPLAFFVIYFLAQLRKRGANRQPAAEESAAAPEAPRKRTPFEDIIRQIQEAAAEAQAVQQVEPTEPIVEALEAPPTLLQLSEIPPQGLQSSEFRAHGAFEHDQHGFGELNPFSEEVFESQPSSPPPPPHAKGHLQYDPHRPVVDRSSRGRRRVKMHPFVERLKDSAGLEEALILKEILDKPVALRRR